MESTVKACAGSSPSSPTGQLARQDVGDAVIETADRDLETRDAFFSGDRGLAAGANRLHERRQLRPQRLGVANRQMPHRIASVGLKAEALGDLTGEQVAD